MANPTPTKNAMDAALAEIRKRFGEGAIMKLDEKAAKNIPAISTGSPSLDLAIGPNVMGIPRGRIIEIYGPESSGKSTLCQHIVAEAQKAGGAAAYIDMEHALDPAYAAKCGVNIAELVISQPNNGEEALEIAETLVRSGAFAVVVIDSVAALVPRSEIEGDMGQATMGVQARLMSQACRKLNSAVAQTNTAMIFTNQLRMKIGVMFGNPETTTGGNALKFYASVRLDIRRKEAIKAGNEVIGNHVAVKVVKNKVAPPFRSAEFDIMFGAGISKESDLLSLGVKLGTITKRGSFLSYGETRLGQGAEAARKFLVENPRMYETILAATMAAAKGDNLALISDEITGEEDDGTEVAPEE